MADHTYRDEGARVRAPKESYKGTKVVDKLPEVEPGLEDVPLLESFIAPVNTYRKMATKLMSAGGKAEKVKKYKKGGSVGAASKRADGIAQRGKTKGRMI